MRIPEPKEDKVTATGGGLCASGLLKPASLLKAGLFVLQCALTESFHAVFSNNPHNTLWSGPQTQPTRKGLGKNLARKCLECWNAAVSVDEGTNITSANQRSS